MFDFLTSLNFWQEKVFEARAFTPSLEFCTEGCTQFLPEHPFDMVVKGNFNKIPIIVGVNSDEGAFFANGKYFLR